jgi:hypothetical protein
MPVFRLKIFRWFAHVGKIHFLSEGVMVGTGNFYVKKLSNRKLSYILKTFAKPKYRRCYMSTLKGGCLCGNIRYELLTEPRATYACHCRFCQRDTGTAHRSGLSYLDESVIFSGDSPKTYTYRSERFPEGRVMMIGTLDDPSLVDVKTHMFVDEAFSWITYSKEHVVYAKHRINADGTPAVPLTNSTDN